ncbi:MAG TPA: tRNA (adenosine(37)-N6)-threonylcarbamoyltransferase complex ATPase subunit type 1 TsaE [Deltaproteobacteria bacterium]|nr:tRNA (adenosine(37)-N6)-threonylcarbamoyltransferase complex ATPase subunit type 1 TsaE [Deltaproteobacteria bacterium]HOM28289.1 tRNA (adenosine(37)-N6)-threonylcarbamoyltransferase complex ATPase subunit type 1 TsaE [Deltaproteobacteria bacterium]HPP80656.1 tRNA (adenosine(37)-N6)-threonylcarbamoyltransferase complex ATPase subunit type 1 TsaE [Deltaproteobacteria bacterium]
MTTTFASSSPLDTLEIGARLGSLLKGGEIVLITGELGTGKTMLAKGIAKGLDADPSTPVLSPSFTLVNIYHARLDIVHVDLYRLDSEEIVHLGLEDYLDSGHVLVVEWADRAQGYFRGDLVEIAISHAGEDAREIRVSSDVPWLGPLAG